MEFARNLEDTSKKKTFLERCSMKYVLHFVHLKANL